MSRPFRVSKFKKSAPSIRALWKRAGPSTLKTVENCDCSDPPVLSNMASWEIKKSK